MESMAGAGFFITDLKPENMGFSKDGKLKFFDLGDNYATKPNISDNASPLIRKVIPSNFVSQNYCCHFSNTHTKSKKLKEFWSDVMFSRINSQSLFLILIKLNPCLRTS